MVRVFTLELGPDHEGLAVRDLLKRRLKISRALYRRLRDCDGVRLDGQAAAPFEPVHQGQILTLDLTPRPSSVEPVDMALSIAYEDGFVVVLDKPAGLVVHPTMGVSGPTLASGLAARYGTFHLVHRLDQETSGLLVVAKDPLSAQRLTEALRRREVARRYRAIVHGALGSDSGTIEAPIARRPGLARRVVAEDGQPALTHFTVVHRQPDVPVSWLELALETGRTHQIRVHLAHIGHPILGDDRYGPSPRAWPRLCLHAVAVEFPHPRTGQRIRLEAPWPRDLPDLPPEPIRAIPQ